MTVVANPVLRTRTLTLYRRPRTNASHLPDVARYGEWEYEAYAVDWSGTPCHVLSGQPVVLGSEWVAL